VLGVLAAETAILLHLNAVGGILLVLEGIVVSLLALAASQGHFYAHVSAPPCSITPPSRRLNCLPVWADARGKMRTKINLSADR
jgi:hypothetical protein